MALGEPDLRRRLRRRRAGAASQVRRTDCTTGPSAAAPRFGSAHLRLAAQTLERTTFCFPDSFFEPELFGAATAFALAKPPPPPAHDLLDDYVEAQVHGVVGLARDVEALVLDPCYRGTDVEAAAPGSALRSSGTPASA